MGLAGLILGILACLAALVPLFGPLITVPLSAIGIPLSAVAVSNSKNQPNQTRYKLAVAGLVLSIASLPIMVVNTVARW